jgi:hypothetical protein
MAAPDDAASMSAASVINMKIEMSDEARARLEAAQQKAVAHDGKGCLKELDAHDALDPSHKSTDPKSGFGLMRAQCVMMAGKCNAGKALARKSIEATSTIDLGPEQLDNQADGMAMMWCEGDSMSKRDQLLQAVNRLQNAAYMSAKDVGYCDEQWAKIKKLAPKVKPKDEYDTQIVHLDRTLYSLVPKCYEKAGDCKKAFQSFETVMPQEMKDGFKDLDPATRDEIVRNNFESLAQKCKGK